jgi:hypothetical protein
VDHFCAPPARAMGWAGCYAGAATSMSTLVLISNTEPHIDVDRLRPLAAGAARSPRGGCVCGQTVGSIEVIGAALQTLAGELLVILQIEAVM